MTLDLQQAARDHLWLHFTRMSAYADAEVPIIVRGDGLLPRGLRTAGATSTRSQGSSPCRSATRTARRSARRRSSRCASCRSTRTGRTRTRARSSWRTKSPQLDTRRPEPRVLRLRRLGGGRGRMEARAPVPRRPRRAPLEGDRPPHRLPRHDDGCALDQRHRGDQERVRAARPGHAPRAEHEPLPPPRRGDGGGVHRVPARRPRAGDHRRRAPRRWRW